MLLTNHGLVVADRERKTLLLGTNAKTSDGVLRAENGALLDITATLTSTGLAEATGGGTLRAGNPSGNYSAGTLTGGTWQVFETSTMQLIGANIQTLAATILLDGIGSNLYRDNGTTDALTNLSSITADGRLEIRGGRALATGVSLANGGEIAIGAGSVFAVGSAYSQMETGEFALEIAGTDSTEYGRMRVPGAATLSGRLVIETSEGFEPEDGDSFAVLTYASRSGAFTEIVAEIDPGETWDTVYTQTKLLLIFRRTETGVAELPADEASPSTVRFGARTAGGGSIVLDLALPWSAEVSVSIYDLAGREIARPIERVLSVGEHAVPWDGEKDGGGRAASGVYFALGRIRATSGTLERRAHFVFIR